MVGSELPEYLREYAEYKDCDRFARNFVTRYPQANYRRIMLIRKTTSNNFGIQEHSYLNHSWIEYNGMLLMAYSGLDSGSGSYTVSEHFKRNTLTPDQLHEKINEFIQYCVDVTGNMQINNSVPTDFIENVESYQRDMFIVGLSRVEKEKLKSDFELADASTFTFEIKVIDINGDEVKFAPVKKPPMGGKKRTKRRRRTKRKLTKRRKTRKGKKGKRRRTKRRR